MTTGKGENAMHGKVAVITGAARGLGRACAMAFAAQGADLVLLDVCHSIDGVPYALGTESQLDAAAKSCCGLGSAVLALQCDVRDSQQVAWAVEQALERFGAVDVLVNCAGIAAPSGTAAHEITEQQWSLMLDVDLSGAWRLMKAVAPIMVGRKSGSIINIASTAGLVGYRNFAGYVAAKHGLVGLTKAAALDYAPYKVRVNALCPGSVRDTPEFEGRMLSEIARSLQLEAGNYESAFLQSQPMNALIEPSDVAQAALWLAGDGSSQVTGSVVAVDGGFTAR
jgi:NAD(P)-dependent dehydrogenase (short-subunit alcohol dehydrogenase family)